MTDGRAQARPRDTLSSRLALCFLGIALTAIALLAGLTVVFAAADVSRLVDMHRTDLTSAIASAAAAAWDRHNSWSGADLHATLTFATDTGADAQIRTNSGAVVASSPMFARESGEPLFAAPVVVRGAKEGEAIVRFSGSGLGSADHALRIALLHAIAASAGLAALVAAVSGIIVARRLIRPVVRIIAVTRAMEGGERSARVGDVHGPSELREFALAFDKMADTLDKHEQLRRDLVADVAHELRTPVAVLQAGHEALLDGLAEPTPEQLGSLRDEVLRLAAMVGDLQTLAAADAASLQLTGHECDLAEIAAVAADSLDGRFAGADTTLRRQLESVQVIADPRWLHQVVTNLLTNALKYSPAAGTISIVTGPRDDDAVLEVVDHGIGIPAEDLPRIFDRFWRGQEAAAHTSGSGIGLAVAAELTRAHGGTLTATSRLGQGTRMTVTLPQAGLARDAPSSRRRMRNLPAGRAVPFFRHRDQAVGRNGFGAAFAPAIVTGSESVKRIVQVSESTPGNDRPPHQLLQRTVRVRLLCHRRPGFVKLQGQLRHLMQPVPPACLQQLPPPRPAWPGAVPPALCRNRRLSSLEGRGHRSPQLPADHSQSPSVRLWLRGGRECARHWLARNHRLAGNHRFAGNHLLVGNNRAAG